jgi:hypothetical protein
MAGNKGVSIAANSARRQRFAIEYCRNGFRGAPAAVKVGYSTKGARQIASKLLRMTDVQEHVRRLAADKLKRGQMAAEEVIARVAAVARADVRQLFDDQGVPLPIDQLDDDIAMAVRKVSITKRSSSKGDQSDETDSTTIELESRVPALQIMARYHRIIDGREERETIDAQSRELGAQERIEASRRLAFALVNAGEEIEDVEVSE